MGIVESSSDVCNISLSHYGISIMGPGPDNRIYLLDVFPAKYVLIIIDCSGQTPLDYYVIAQLFPILHIHLYLTHKCYPQLATCESFDRSDSRRIWKHCYFGKAVMFWRWIFLFESFNYHWINSLKVFHAYLCYGRELDANQMSGNIPAKLGDLPALSAMYVSPLLFYTCCKTSLLV